MGKLGIWLGEFIEILMRFGFAEKLQIRVKFKLKFQISIIFLKIKIKSLAGESILH